MGAVSNLDRISSIVVATPFRRRPQHHVRRFASSHRRRIRRVGQSSKEEDYFYMKSVLPLHQPRRKNYPRMLIKTASTIPKSCTEKPQYVAKLRTLKTDGIHSSSKPTWAQAMAVPAATTTPPRNRLRLRFPPLRTQHPLLRLLSFPFSISARLCELCALCELCVIPFLFFVHRFSPTPPK